MLANPNVGQLFGRVWGPRPLGAGVVATPIFPNLVRLVKKWLSYGQKTYAYIYME